MDCVSNLKIYNFYIYMHNMKNVLTNRHLLFRPYKKEEKTSRDKEETVKLIIQGVTAR